MAKRFGYRNWKKTLLHECEPSQASGIIGFPRRTLARKSIRELSTLGCLPPRNADDHSYLTTIRWTCTSQPIWLSSVSGMGAAARNRVGRRTNAPPPHPGQPTLDWALFERLAETMASSHGAARLEPIPPSSPAR